MMNLQFKKNKYITVAFLCKKIVALSFVFMPTLVFAIATDAGGSGGGGGVSFPNPINKQSILEIVTAVLDFVTQLGAVIAVLFMVYAGFLFVLARGNPGMLDKAKSTFLWTVVGAMIVLGSFVLSEIIQNTAKNFGVGS
jgi:hypothetical protein